MKNNANVNIYNELKGNWWVNSIIIYKNFNLFYSDKTIKYQRLINNNLLGIILYPPFIKEINGIHWRVNSIKKFESKYNITYVRRINNNNVGIRLWKHMYGKNNFGII